MVWMRAHNSGCARRSSSPARAEQVAGGLPDLQAVAVVARVVGAGEVVRRVHPLQAAFGEPGQGVFEKRDRFGQVGVGPGVGGGHQALAEQGGDLGLQLLFAEVGGEGQRLAGRCDGRGSLGGAGRLVQRVQPFPQSAAEGAQGIEVALERLLLRGTAVAEVFQEPLAPAQIRFERGARGRLQFRAPGVAHLRAAGQLRSVAQEFSQLVREAGQYGVQQAVHLGLLPVLREVVQEGLVVVGRRLPLRHQLGAGRRRVGQVPVEVTGEDDRQQPAGQRDHLPVEDGVAEGSGPPGLPEQDGRGRQGPRPELREGEREQQGCRHARPQDEQRRVDGRPRAASGTVHPRQAGALPAQGIGALTSIDDTPDDGRTLPLTPLAPPRVGHPRRDRHPASVDMPAGSGGGRA